MAECVRVEVCLALPTVFLRRELNCEPGASCAEAVAASGLMGEAQRLGIEVVAVGVYGKRRMPADPVYDGDRIELYRALIADPKAARRRRATRLRAPKAQR